MTALAGQVKQVLLPHLLLLLLPISRQMSVESGETLPNGPSKHQLPASNNRGSETARREKVTLSPSSSAAGAKRQPPDWEEARVETESDEADEGPLDRRERRPDRKTPDSKPTKPGRRAGGKRPNPAVESAKSDIIREFVVSHGDRIRKSRKHADLFDGSGYLIDMMKELHQYESRAEEDASQSRRRHRRSTTATDGNDDPDLPNFASLSEALAQLNGGRQEEIISADLNVRFVDDEDNEEQREVGEDGQPASESKRPRRRKRSLGNPDDDDEEDGDDLDWWLKDDDKLRGNPEAEEEDEFRRQTEAAESMQRLDADLKELAKYLDEQAAEEQLLQREEEQLNPLRNFNRGMTAAYKNLVKLRDMAQGQSASAGSAEPPQPRMRDLYPDKTASWQIDAEVLDATLRDLKKYYRQIDEL